MASTSSDDLSAVLEDQPSSPNEPDDLTAVLSPSVSSQSPPLGVLGTINKYAGLINRGLTEGVTAIPAIVGDPLVSGYNAIAPHVGLPQSPTNVSGLVNAAANKLGMPEPNNLPESLLTGAASAVGSMAVPIPLLDKLKPGTSQALLNNSWAKSIGEDADKITSNVLNGASSRIGEVFDSIRDETPRAINTPQISTALNSLDEDFKGLIGNGTTNVTDHPLVQKLIQFATDPSGTATGEQLGKLSSQLGKASTKQFLSPAGDPDLGDALSKVKNLVDDVVQQGLSPEENAAYSTARSQYRSMMQMLQSRALNVDTGDINPSTLGSYLQRTDRYGYAMGNNNADHYAMTRSMRSQSAPSDLLSNLKPAGIPVGPALQKAYKVGALPPVIKGVAGAYEGLSQPDTGQP